jgi:raffinose/stachyose/melibiose transport system permease protein
MLVPFQAVMFPMLNVFEKIGMKNIWGLVIMYGGFGMSMSIFLYHGFMKSVPVSLEEAAVLDGAGAIQIFLKVVFPLVKGTTSTVIILNALWIWNDYLLPYLVLDLKKYKTIPIVIQYLKGGYGAVDWGTMMAMLVLAIIPIIIFYGICQKYIIEGVVAGAVKG